MTIPATVLVVDDAPPKRYILASWLRRGGYTVVEASTGTEALELARRPDIDLVVLDVRLPDMTGFEVCEQIKADATRDVLPVVHVSAAAIHAVDRTRGLERGADAYLVEPIDPDELLATVAAILRYYQAREQAERLARRLATLTRTTLAMSAATSQRALLATAAEGAATIHASPAVVIADIGDGVNVAAVSRGPGLGMWVRSWAPVTGRVPVGVAYTDEQPGRWPDAGWPEGATLRVLTARPRADRTPVYVVVPTDRTDDDAAVLTLLGQAVMSALDVMRTHDREHDLALTLQHSLLPRRLPYIEGFDFAVRYVPATDHAEIGGDFYELARIGDRLVVAVGDVGGHSLHAAMIMAELRHATRAYMAEGHGPGGALEQLNRLMQELIPDEIATLCLLSIDTATGHTRLANAGHPPPLIVSPDRTRYIRDRSPLLGARIGPVTEIEFVFEPGETLVLYTDGLIETRTETHDEGLARLASASATVEADLETFASRLLARVGPPVPSDDIAMVAVRRHFAT